MNSIIVSPWTIELAARQEAFGFLHDGVFSTHAVEYAVDIGKLP